MWLRSSAETVVVQVRKALLAAVHFGNVLPAPGRPRVLRIEGPGALNGAGERVVVGHEKALRKAGFVMVECLGADPHDPRGRPGRSRAEIPAPGGAWDWERLTGEELQDRIMGGDETAVSPRPLQAVEKPAPVLSLPVRRRAR